MLLLSAEGVNASSPVGVYWRRKPCNPIAPDNGPVFVRAVTFSVCVLSANLVPTSPVSSISACRYHWAVPSTRMVLMNGLPVLIVYFKTP